MHRGEVRSRASADRVSPLEPAGRVIGARTSSPAKPTEPDVGGISRTNPSAAGRTHSTAAGRHEGIRARRAEPTRLAAGFHEGTRARRHRNVLDCNRNCPNEPGRRGPVRACPSRTRTNLRVASPYEPARRGRVRTVRRGPERTCAARTERTCPSRTRTNLRFADPSEPARREPVRTARREPERTRASRAQINLKSAPVRGCSTPAIPAFRRRRFDLPRPLRGADPAGATGIPMVAWTRQRQG
jgi:hypothetical protein